MRKDYYVGLDIGTNSVGWAVTDENYNLCNFRGKDMWGIRLFEDAQTAAERRVKRAGRRRLARRKERVRLLQELFAVEMAKVDPEFFIRLNESSRHLEDKTIKVKNPIFIGGDYTEAQYYNDYPTIFHLRKELIHSESAHDIRLVYLALHNIIKHRGHFLIDGNLSAAKDFGNTFRAMITAINSVEGVEIYCRDEDIAQISEILARRDLAKSKKATQIKGLLELSFDDEDIDDKNKKTACDNLAKLIVGNKGDIAKVFLQDFDGLEKTSIELSSAAYEETQRGEIESGFPEIVIALDAIKAVYDWSVLVDILRGQLYISDAKVALYEKHQSDLKRLKAFVRAYCDDKTYNALFVSQTEKVSYSSYVGSTLRGGIKYTLKGCKEEDFFKLLKKTIETSSCKKDDAEYVYLSEEITNQTLLPKLRTKSNSVVPKQVNEEELCAILENASQYMGFLNDVDESGISVKEKIHQLFNYKIPYYVGPLTDKNQNGKGNFWMVRKEGKTGPILPWNFKDMVDEEASNEAFIRRMTNKCSYLLNEDVIAKNSILYSRYMVLNELNNLKIRSHKISVGLKKELYTELFEKHTRVTRKMLLKYLQNNGDQELKEEDLSGFDGDFKASLNSYLDFEKKVFGEKIKEYKYVEIAEECINLITIYGNDKKMLRKVIEARFKDQLTDEEIAKICKLNYSGWGNFSKKFLVGIEGANQFTGEVFSIIKGLWETNNNLMQLLSEDFTFTKQITEINNAVVGEVGKITYENVVEDLYISPANKRAVWQTIQIVEEIKKVKGYAPKRIFIEMARGPEEKQKKKRTVSRKQKLIDLYNACEKDVRDEWVSRINQHEERDFNSIKLYLYYTQMGRCAYSGEAIGLEELMSKNSRWDRDHIFPQSRIKDDSLDNMVLAKKTYNIEKDNGLVKSAWQQNMRPMWEQWYKCGLISKKKLDRLTKTGDFTEEELAGFISRQLVETRQTTKAVKDVFERIYKESTVVCVKAGLVSDFRKAPLGCLKSRLINDYHHAKDAYLNIVVGNVYDAKFTSNPVQWMRENRDTNYSLNKVFYYDVTRGNQLVWKAPGFVDGKATKNEKGEIATGHIDTVRKVMRQNNILYTEYTYFGKGQLFDETVFSPDENPRIPLKKDLDVNKYGGYKSAKSSYFVLIEFDGKKGERQRRLTGIPIYVSNQLSYNENAVLEYLEKEGGYENVTILRDKIKKNSLIVSEGFPMRIRGENEVNILLKGNIQLLLDQRDEETLRKIEKLLGKTEQETVIEKYDHITDEDLRTLFVSLTKKATDGPYRKRPANQGENASNSITAFNNLSIYDKCKLLNCYITMFSTCATTSLDLSLIGLQKNGGNIAKNKNTIANDDIVFVDQSITGLFENRKKY